MNPQQVIAAVPCGVCMATRGESCTVSPGVHATRARLAYVLRDSMKLNALRWRIPLAAFAVIVAAGVLYVIVLFGFLGYVWDALTPEFTPTQLPTLDGSAERSGAQS